MKKLTFIFKLLCPVVIFLSGFYTTEVYCQDPEVDAALRKKVAPLLFEYKLDKAMAACNSFDKSSPDVIAVKSMIYSLKGNMDKDEDLIEKGFSMLDPYKTRKNNYNIHVALAVSYGIQANHSGLKEKIRISEMSIQHSKEALKLNPKLPHPNFILGRFYYELSKMNNVTAKLAKTMLNKEEIERASFDLALSYLEKASTLLPTRFLYNYYTGAAYDKLGNKEKAMHYFRLADNNKRHTADDLSADKDLQKQLR